MSESSQHKSVEAVAFLYMELNKAKFPHCIIYCEAIRRLWELLNAVFASYTRFQAKPIFKYALYETATFVL